MTTLGAETFASGKIREIFAFREHKLSRIGQNIIFRVLNFREWTEKLNLFVVLRKRLDPGINKREKKISFVKYIDFSRNLFSRFWYLYNTNCLLFCTEKYKPEVDNADRACEVCILTEGLYFEHAHSLTHSQKRQLLHNRLCW